MDFLSTDAQGRKEYREKLMGESSIDNAPGRYWELQMIVNMGSIILGWDDLTIHKKAEYRAYYQLNNMAELLKQHAQNMKENRKAAMDKIEAAAKANN